MSTEHEIREDAARTIRRILEALKFPESVAAFLRGHAAGLEAKPKRRRKSD